MNAEVKAMPTQNQSMKPNQIMLIGRLDRCSKYEGKFDHIITLPAPDEYSKPSVVRLSSTQKIGDLGEMVKCLAVFNGWPNNYKVTSENGDRRDVYDAKGFFVAVE